MAWPGEARWSEAWQGKAMQGSLGWIYWLEFVFHFSKAWRGYAGQGVAWQSGQARRGDNGTPPS